MALEDTNTFSAIGVKKSNDKLVILNTTNTNNNILYHSTSNNDNVDTLSIKNIVNKGGDLNICTYSENTIQPIIQIDNTHQHVNITSNLNVTSNLNISKNINIYGTTNTHDLKCTDTIKTENIILSDSNGYYNIYTGQDNTTPIYIKSNNESNTGIGTGTYVPMIKIDSFYNNHKWTFDIYDSSNKTDEAKYFALRTRDSDTTYTNLIEFRNTDSQCDIKGSLITKNIYSNGVYRSSSPIKDHIILKDGGGHYWYLTTAWTNNSFFEIWNDTNHLMFQIRDDDWTQLGKLKITGGTDSQTYRDQIPLIVEGEHAAGNNNYYLQNGVGIGTGRVAGAATFTYTNKTSPLSAKFQQSIVLGTSGEVFWYSDQRIKTNISNISTNTSLEIIKSINCKYYEYIDKTRNTNVQTIGFIAQEIKTQIPEAVSLHTEFIPDVYQVITCIWNNTTMTSDTLTNVSGIKYKFYVSNNSDGSDETEKIIVGNSDDTFTFEQKYNNVFCFGKQVDDFHILDENKIYKLHHGAIQEIDNIQQQQQTKINILENENIELKNKINILEQNHKILEDRLSIIENMLNTQ